MEIEYVSEKDGKQSLDSFVCSEEGSVFFKLRESVSDLGHDVYHLIVAFDQRA